MRIIKILLALNMALLCLVYVGQNFFNLDSTFGALAYVLGNTDHQVYPDSFGPTLTSSALVWIAVIVVLGFETISGLVLFKGAMNLAQARNAVPADFQAAKKLVYIGAGLGMLTWFGLFHVMGGALFQMWQTTVGDGSLGGAFWIGGILALSALFIALVPDD
jgi:predicted small integral membrane protein